VVSHRPSLSFLAVFGSPLRREAARNSCDDRGEPYAGTLQLVRRYACYAVHSLRRDVLGNVLGVPHYPPIRGRVEREEEEAAEEVETERTLHYAKFAPGLSVLAEDRQVDPPKVSAEARHQMTFDRSRTR
jgi:hypothetical protein